MAMATTKLLSLSILCFLLALQHYHSVLEAARILLEDQPHHGDDESSKGAVRGHPGKPDGSHVSHAPTSKSTVASSHYVSTGPCGTQALESDLGSPKSVCQMNSHRRTVPSPKLPDTDPLEAHHFNCTVCE